MSTLNSAPLVQPGDVESYYRYSNWLYRLFCYNPSSLGMHHGFWDKRTKNRHEAMLIENDFVAKAAGITKGMSVLDAGCGVGGTAIYIAKNYQAKVTGISFDSKQIEIAKQYARKYSVEDLVDFQVQDYTKTNFHDNQFDVIYGIESICHAYAKEKFLKEAHRLVKFGGKLIVADGYASHKPRNEYEQNILSEYQKSFAIPDFGTPEQFTTLLEDAGFAVIKTISKIDAVKPAILGYARLARFTKNYKIVSVITQSVFEISTDE